MRPTALVLSMLACLLLAAVAGCSTPPPTHFPGSYELEHTDGAPAPESGIEITEIHQNRVLPGNREKITTDLAVDFRVDSDNTSIPGLTPSDIELVADVPEGSRLVADESGPRRPPDTLYVRRDGDWIETDSVDIERRKSHRIRAEFEGVLPYIRPDREGTRYYRPVDLHVEVSDSETSNTDLTLTNTDDYAPAWSRTDADPRPFTAFTADMVDLARGVGFGTTIKHQVRFPNDFYFSGGLSVHGSDVHVQLASPLTGGHHWDLPTGDLGLGTGWALSSSVTGADADAVLSHWGILELSLGIDEERNYPYQSSDYMSDSSIYTRVMVRLGNFTEPAAEPAGVIVSTGFAFHPADVW